MLEYHPPAKINLFLDIISKRKDGYHDILSLMVKVSLYDRLVMEKHPSGEIILEVEGEAPSGRENICYKATELICKRFKIKEGVRLKLIKNIPPRSGLGGASSDCAGVIKLMNQLFCLNLSEQEQMSLGSTLGSDVPFFIQSASWGIVEGRGERVTKLNPAFSFYSLIIIPDFGVDTARAYSLWRPSLTQNVCRDRIKFCKSEEIDLNFLKDISYNIFEHMIDDPDIVNYRKILQNCGAEIVRMTGSGSAIYGIFRDKEKAEQSKHRLSSEGYRVFLVESI